MKILVLDIGGSNVKVFTSGRPDAIKFPSGKTMTPRQLVAQVLKLEHETSYDAVSIGFPGPVIHGKPMNEPKNLGKGWVSFDFRKAFGKPVKLINDAALQAIGSYQGRGRMLFLGLGTGLGSALVTNEIVLPLELSELRYSRTQTVEAVLSKAALKKGGLARWERAVHATVANLRKAFLADYVVLGGGNVKRLSKLPVGAVRGANRNAFRGGLRLWQRPPAAARSEATGITII